MKKLLFALMAIAILFVSCKKDEQDDDTPKGIVVKNEQWALAINYTATWCGPCGSSGAPVIKDVGSMERVVAITPHAAQGDPMHVASYYTQFASERPTGGGIPAFYVNDEKTTTGGTKAAVQNALSMFPKAGLGMEATREGAVYKVKVKAEWFEAGTGNYYLSVILLEDGIDGSSTAGAYKQAGATDPNYKHMFVLRSAATTNLYGDNIASSPAAGFTIEKEYTIDILPDWKETVYPIAILWKHDTSGDKPHYKFVNAFKL